MADKKIGSPDEYPPDDKYTRAYAITRVLVRLLVPLWGGLTVRGGENIPDRGPVILAPNHRAYMDPPYLSMVLKRQLRMMGKEELFQVPVIGSYIRAMSAFPVKRGSADRAAIRQAIEEIKAGHVLGIFPEGKRSDPGTLSRRRKALLSSPSRRERRSYPLHWKGRIGSTRSTPNGCTAPMSRPRSVSR